jgi:hypothetical protein
VSEANRLLFSALANDRFYSWLEEYQARLINELRETKRTKPDLDKVAQDISQAILEHGDANLVLSLGLQGRPVPSDVFRTPASAFVLVDDVAIGVHVYLVFKFVKYFDFLVTFDPEEDFDVRLTPAQLRAISEQIIEHAKALKDAGALSDPTVQFT